MPKLIFLEALQRHINPLFIESVVAENQNVGEIDGLPVTMERVVLRMSSGAEYILFMGIPELLEIIGY